jgi:hypothetical protein
MKSLENEINLEDKHFDKSKPSAPNNAMDDYFDKSKPSAPNILKINQHSEIIEDPDDANYDH